MKKSPVFALIDCNNFFVSCERVFRPDLWNKPVVVLSNNDACIVARSNEVKALGIQMAIPYFKVRDTLKANNVTLFSANFQLYGDFSQRVVAILQAAAPKVEIYSVDESFLEISSLPDADYHAWAQRLRKQIFQWTGIPVSIGIAPTKTLAKAASEYAKKNFSTDGVYSLAADARLTSEAAEQRRIDLLKWLSVGEVWGIGWRTAPKLHQRGVTTAHDLVQVSDVWAQAQLTIRGLQTVRELRGESWLAIEETQEPQQSIAKTRSFGHTVRNYFELEGAVATFAAQASAKLRAQGEMASAVLVFLRTARQHAEHRGASTVVKLMQPSADTGVIIEAAQRALQTIHDPDFGYQKAGVVLVKLTSDKAVQVSLFESAPERLDRQRQLMQAVDTINKQFHTRLIRHASEYFEKDNWRSRRDYRSPSYTTSWAELPKVA